jgi:hypothetical protein
MITDLQYLNFLHALLADQRGKNALALTEWENDFVGSFAQSAQSARWITEGRRKSIDRLWRRYGAELNHRHPLDCVPQRQSIPEADTDGCQYLVRDEGRQLPCNNPAEFCEPGRLRYCQLHAEAVEKAMKRAKKSFALVKYP